MARARDGLAGPRRGPARARAPGHGRPRERVRDHRGGRAGDDPLRLRARRHPDPRGHGASHRHDHHAATTPLSKALSLFLRSGFSRLPVTGTSVDDLVGVVYFKDVVKVVNASPDAARGRWRTSLAPRSSCRSPSRSTTCCARCRLPPPTSRWSSTSTAAWRGS
ncbi:CBS domain-containing protein [Oerskovia sp. M15]